MWSALELQQYWQTANCCHLCGAHKTEIQSLYTDFRRAGRTRRSLRSHAEWLALAPAGGPSPLTAIPGFCIWRCSFDIMHTLELGILQVAIPSALQELATTAPAEVAGAGSIFGMGPPAARMCEATRQYHRWCAVNGVASKVSRITPAWIEGATPAISQKHAKAAALRSMMYWLRDICVAAAGGSGHSALRAAFFDCLVKADEVMRAHGRFLPAQAGEDLAKHVEDALLAYNALAVSSFRAGARLWPLKPKLHALTHIAYDHCRVNPRSVHCYADEDMVGRVKRIYIRCHPSSAPLRSLERYVLHTTVRWWREMRRARGLLPAPAAAASRSPAPAGEGP